MHFCPTTVSGYEVWISKDKNSECLNRKDRFKESDIDECRQKCDGDPNCYFFSISIDHVCKTIKNCDEQNQKLSNNPVTTYHKTQGNILYSNRKKQGKNRNKYCHSHH